LIVSEAPHKTLAEAEVAVFIAPRSEIPRTSSNNYCILKQCLDEFHNPEEGKNLYPQKRLLLIIKFYLLILTSKRRLRDFTSRQEQDKERNPEHRPHHDNYRRKKGHEKHPNISHDDKCSSF